MERDFKDNMPGFARIIFRLSVVLLMLYPTVAFGSVGVMNIRHWTATDHTRIVIDTSQEAKYKLEKSDKKLTIDFIDAVAAKGLPRRIVLNKPGIERIQTSQRPDRTLRIELFLPGGVESKVFKLKKFQDKPDRVVIDIGLPDVAKQESITRKEVKIQRKAKIVIIDPGHGGDDPGAIGKGGTREKTVVLAISKKLRDILNSQNGYRAFLTRKGDYYVSFNKRLTIAREYGADLFVSIHADAFRGRSARGSSVYCLSLRGASSEAGRILAKNENLSDVIGGVPDAESSDESDPIVLNMFQTNTINQSKAFGNQVIRHLNGVNHIKHAVVQEAPFRVLKLPDIPSLLIETAFISNPGEEQLLKSGRHQAKLANAIADAIVEFIPIQPPEKPKIIITKDQGKKKTGGLSADPGKKRPSVYKVRKGDTIASIAQKYETTIAVLLKLNNMKLDDPLFVDRKIKLPAQEADKKQDMTDARQTKKNGTKTYKVVRGDTLGIIAGRFEVDVEKLASLNNMDIKDPLYVGRRLKIPERTQQEGALKKEEQEKDVSPEIKKPEVPPAKTHIYKVKEGDTVLIIARKCNTTIGELLRLNNIQLTDPLYIDQELVVPDETPK